MTATPFITHLATRELPTADGGLLPLDSQIPERFAWALHRTTLNEQPEAAIEIGMATGTSALAITSAMEQAGSGRLLSIDPNQSGQWRGAGLTALATHGLAHRHEVIEQPDFLALPDLLAAGNRFQLAYVDGWHTFDYVTLDVFFIDKMLDVGGVIGFNDCRMPATRKAIRFLLSHRRYEEIDVGLNKYGASTRPRTVANFLLHRKPADRYFRKLEDWEPTWDFFRRF